MLDRVKINISKKLIDSKITKSNKLIEAGFKLSLLEQRLVLKLASMIERGDVDFKEYPFDINGLIKEFGMNRNSGYRDLVTALKGLHSKVLVIREADGPLLVNFISSSKEKRAAGTITLRFDPSLKPYLIQLTNNFTVYEVENVLRLTSMYSYRIYELLKQYMWKEEKYRQRIISIEDIRFYLGMEENKLYGDIKRHILFSQKELAEKSDISFTFEEIKKGRRVDSVLFNIIGKEEPISSLPVYIWQWVKKWEQSTGKLMNIFDREASENNKTMSYLNLLISKLSESKVKALWDEELAKANPNPINLLTKTFPAELFKLKQNRL